MVIVHAIKPVVSSSERFSGRGMICCTGYGFISIFRGKTLFFEVRYLSSRRKWGQGVGHSLS